jgi:hypothetical protein
MLNETETLPEGQTFTPRGVRILKMSIAVMSALLVLGFGLLLVGIYFQASKIGTAPGGAPAAATASGGAETLPVAVDPGTEVAQVLADQGRLILHLKREGKSEFAVIDLATGREVRRITVGAR